MVSLALASHSSALASKLFCLGLVAFGLGLGLQPHTLLASFTSLESAGQRSYINTVFLRFKQVALNKCTALTIQFPDGLVLCGHHTKPVTVCNVLLLQRIA